MKHLKLTFATTLSFLAIAFTGAASADKQDVFQNWKHDYKQNHELIDVVVDSKKPLKANLVRKGSSKSKLVATSVKQFPSGKIVRTTTVFQKPIKKRLASNKQLNDVNQFDDRWKVKSRDKRFTNHKRINRMKHFEERVDYKKYVARHERFTPVDVTKTAFYSVRSGDTLIEISRKTGVSLRKITHLNRFKNGNHDHLRIGQILKLS